VNCRIPFVYISKEICARNNLNGSHSQVISNVDVNFLIASLWWKQLLSLHLVRALQKPADKYSSRNNVLPSYRFYRDYYKLGKYLQPLDVIGFSINPEVVPGRSIVLPQILIRTNHRPFTLEMNWTEIVSASSALSDRRVFFVILYRSNIVKTAFSGRKDNVVLQLAIP